MPQNNALNYAALMVRLSVRGGDEGLLQVAGDLAERFDADLTGIVAYPAMPQMYQSMQIACGGIVSPEDLVNQYNTAAHGQIEEAEMRFRSALLPRVRALAWRSAIVHRDAARYFARQARLADLFVTYPAGTYAPLDVQSVANVGDIVMNIGRPVLVVPPGQKTLNLDTALVGWKDTRASRRVVWDALPMLAIAKDVVVVEIADADKTQDAIRHTDEVVAWLGKHGIAARPRIETSSGNDANRLAALIKEENANLFVAGAYGHARFREWALGGVTSDLLMHPEVLTFVSH